MSQMKPIMGSRFITGDRPTGMGLKFFDNGEKGVIAPLTLDDRHEGPPDHVHGGFSAALVDEAMGGAVWRAGHQVVAANLNINYRLPVPLGVEIVVRGWVDRVEGRKVFAAGNVTLPDGRVAVEGQGLFVLAPHLFAGSDYFTDVYPDLSDVENS